MSRPIAGFTSVPTAGMVVGSSFVNTLENCLLKISDFARPSLTILPSTLKSDTLGSTYDQKRFGFSLIASPRKTEMYASLADFKFFCKRFLAARKSFQCTGFPDFFRSTPTYIYMTVTNSKAHWLLWSLCTTKYCFYLISICIFFISLYIVLC